MTKSSLKSNLDTAINRGRRLLHKLLAFRRGQLVLAVLVGAVLGGGFMAAASKGLDGPQDGDPGHSVVSASDQHPMDPSGYDAGER